MRRIKLALLTLSVACSGLACSSLSVTAHPSGSLSPSGRVPTAVLAGYGQWYEVAEYGRVWRPAHMASDWQPYTRGRWYWQDEAWTWHSDYSWGEATFHYGRWLEHGRYGWVWIPGRTWGPAWVQWRTDGDRIGWVPLGPPGLTVVTRGVSQWCFMERRDMGRGRARRHTSRASVSPARPSGPSWSHGAKHNAKPARAKAHSARVKPAKKTKKAKKAKKTKTRKAKAAFGRARRAN